MTSLHCIPSPTIEYRRQWIGLLTVPNQEQKAALWLWRITWRTPTEVYWPKKIVQAPAKIQSNGRRGRAVAVRSIFTGLLFASIPDETIPGYDPFGDFKAAPGVRDWVRSGDGRPGHISEQEMAWVMELERRENAPPVIIEPHEFKVGETVRIVDEIVGKPRTGVIVRINGDGSLKVEAKWLFGQLTKMDLGPQQVEAV